MNNEMTHTPMPAKLETRRILVVANETVEGAALGELIDRRADGVPAELLVVAPALNSRLRHWLSDEDEARRAAGLRLAASLEHLSTAGIEAEGAVGDADPLQAIADALYGFAAHEIVIASPPRERSHWRTRDLVGRSRRRFAQPIVQVVVEPGEASAPSCELGGEYSELAARRRSAARSREPSRLRGSVADLHADKAA